MAPAFRFRADLESLPAYVPGQRPPAGMSAFKLSSNENPFPPSAAVISAVVDAAADLNRYPDMAAGQLVEALAGRLGVSPERLAVGNGSVAVLETVLTAACAPGDEVVYAWRSFEAYPIAVQVAGATGVPVPLTDDGRHDLTAMAAAITDRTRVVLVCSPNNPTGTVVRAPEMRDFLAKVPREVLVVLDEAYVEFVTDDDAADGLALAAEFKNVLLLRTFSKAYGLAGLRVGYAIARPRLIRGLRAAATPFGVNALGQAAAVAALREADEVATRCARIVTERERVVARLEELGQAVPRTEANFYWLDLGRRATSFAREAAASGAMVRAFDGEGVRVSIGEPEGNDAVLELVASWQQTRAANPVR
ncbi:MAG TPA: histidinol-phosphate transaminase [Actinomycetaceae bacterium]|nr:histidinol-phosphate transaminase [Actinomycetaceae bacterium]